MKPGDGRTFYLQTTIYKRFSNVGQGITFCQSEPQVVVLRVPEKGTIVAHFHNGLPTEHDRAVQKTAAAGYRFANLFLGCRNRAHAHFAATLVEHDRLGPNHGAAWIALEKRNLSIQSVRHRHIIRIQSSDQGRFGHLYTLRQTGRLPLVRATVQLDSWVFELFHNTASSIRRPIIKQEQLKIFKGLVHEAFNGITDELLFVKRCHNY